MATTTVVVDYGGNSGNANTTISYPWKSNWKMLWDNGQFGNFQLDIVGFLAVLGEGSVSANAQVAALSSLFYLPRLIPAPQALLWPTRPESLPPTEGTVTGVESGNVKKHVHHVAHILLGDNMPPFMVRCVRVTKTGNDRTQTWKDRLLRGEQRQAKDKRAMTTSPTKGPSLITARINGPLAWVTLLGCGLSITLFTASILFGDGMSFIATMLLSFLSTLIGLVNKWSLKLPKRPDNASEKRGDVVIRYRNGSFLVVKCSEDVARELYFAPEEIDYNIKSPAVYRLISLVGTLMLMLGVIALANAKLQLQFAWAGAYIIINIAQWVAAAVPAKMHWDLSCYEVEEEGLESGPRNNNFTEALWKAILLTRSKDWVKNGEAAPQTEVWAEWLIDAEEMTEEVTFNEKGVLQEPVWADHGARGVVWNVPRGPGGKAWNGKAEWDEIDRRHRGEKEGISPAKAV